MQITVDIWVTTIVMSERLGDFWSVLHHSIDETETYLRQNGAHEDHVRAMRGDPFIARDWTGERDGRTFTARTESKRVRLEVTVG